MAQFDTSSLQPLQQEADTASQNALNAATSAQTLPDMIKQAITTKYQENPLFGQKETAFKNYLTAGTQNKYAPQNQGGVVFSPTQIRAFESTDQANAMAPLMTLTDMISSGYGGINNAVDSASRAFTANANSLQGMAGIKRQSYLDALDALKTKTGFDLQNEQLAEQKRQFDLTPHGGTGQVAQNQALASLQQDVANGANFKDLYPRYAQDLPEFMIRNAYNAGPVAKQYGPAKETMSDLQTIAQKPTAEMTNRVQALKPASAALSGISDSDINLAGPQNRVAQAQLSLLGGLGVDQKLVGLNQKFQLMKQNVVRALQGARMSDQDIKMAQQYIPSITDTPDTVRTKLSGLQTFINTLSNTSSSGLDFQGGGSGQWEVVP